MNAAMLHFTHCNTIGSSVKPTSEHLTTTMLGPSAIKMKESPECFLDGPRQSSRAPLWRALAMFTLAVLCAFVLRGGTVREFRHSTPEQITSEIELIHGLNCSSHDTVNRSRRS
jgi:hypothetical protein